MNARSYLVVPADRPEQFDKAYASGADVVILDLEDSVAPNAKIAAREFVARWLTAEHRVALRIYSIVIPLAALLLYWFRLRRLPLLNQFIAYIVLCILLPYVSGEYTLVHMYTAWAAFLLFLKLIMDLMNRRHSI